MIPNYLSKQLKEGEEVVQVVRRYWLVVAPVLLGGAVILLLDFFLVAWWFQWKTWGGLGFTLVLLGAITWGGRGWYVWSRNILVITNQRIIDSNQRGLWQRTVSEAPYDKIQDIRYTVRGVWQTLFDYGSIILQTAGTETNLELSGIRHPVALQRMITDIQRQTNHRPNQSGPLTADELLRALGALKEQLGEQPFREFLDRAGRKPGADQS